MRFFAKLFCFKKISFYDQQEQITAKKFANNLFSKLKQGFLLH